MTLDHSTVLQALVDGGKPIPAGVWDLSRPVAVRPSTEPKTTWYEFDWLYRYRDLIALLGLLLVVAGVAAYSIPAACIVFGGSMLAFGLKLSGK